MATAVSELAICLPLITLLVLGGIETADMIHLKGNLRSVAYEGGRAAARFNSDNAEVMGKMNAILPEMDVEDAAISLQLAGGAPNVAQLSRGDQIKILVSAPASKNTVGPLKMFAGRTITAEVIVVRE